MTRPTYDEVLRRSGVFYQRVSNMLHYALFLDSDDSSSQKLFSFDITYTQVIFLMVAIVGYILFRLVRWLRSCLDSVRVQTHEVSDDAPLTLGSIHFAVDENLRLEMHTAKGKFVSEKSLDELEQFLRRQRTIRLNEEFWNEKESFQNQQESIREQARARHARKGNVQSEPSARADTKQFEVATPSSVLTEISALPKGAVVLHASPPGCPFMQSYGGGARVTIQEDANTLVTSTHLFEALQRTGHQIMLRRYQVINGKTTITDVTLDKKWPVTFWSHRSDLDQVHIKVPENAWSQLGTKTLQLADKALVGAPISAIWVSRSGTVYKSHGVLSKNEDHPLMLAHTASTKTGSSGFPILNAKGKIMGVVSHGFKDKQYNVLSSIALHKQRIPIQQDPLYRQILAKTIGVGKAALNYKVFEMNQADYEWDSMIKDMRDMGYDSIDGFKNRFHLNHDIEPDLLKDFTSIFYSHYGSGMLSGYRDCFDVDYDQWADEDNPYAEYEDEDFNQDDMAKAAMTREQWEKGKLGRLRSDLGMDDVNNIEDAAEDATFQVLYNKGVDSSDLYNYEAYEDEKKQFEAARVNLIDAKMKIGDLQSEREKLTTIITDNNAVLRELQDSVAKLKAEARQRREAHELERETALKTRNEQIAQLEAARKQERAARREEQKRIEEEKLRKIQQLEHLKRKESTARELREQLADIDRSINGIKFAIDKETAAQLETTAQASPAELQPPPLRRETTQSYPPTKSSLFPPLVPIEERHQAPADLAPNVSARTHFGLSGDDLSEESEDEAKEFESADFCARTTAGRPRLTTPAPKPSPAQATLRPPITGSRLRRVSSGPLTDTSDPHRVATSQQASSLSDAPPVPEKTTKKKRRHRPKKPSGPSRDSKTGSSPPATAGR